jgi:hypothetical protein
MSLLHAGPRGIIPLLFILSLILVRLLFLTMLIRKYYNLSLSVLPAEFYSFESMRSDQKLV